MIKFFKYKNGEIKITWNEQHFIKDYKYNWYKKQIDIKTSEFLSSFSLGVEIEIHTGGRICYGMLNAQVRPCTRQNCVKVALAFTCKNTVKYNDSILFNDNYVFKGLPKEYAEPIINYIYSTILEKENYPQCEIIIENSANCEIGSSTMIFVMIIDIILNIIHMGSEQEIYNMDIENFTKQYVKKIVFALKY